MIIRRENKNEYDTIYKLVKTAFETAPVTDMHEQDLVTDIRASEKYIPELTLVAEKNGDLIGHIMLSRTWVADGTSRHEVLYLAPLSVALEHRGQGVGSRLIQIAMKLATEMGYKAVFLAGDPAYYSRFGFVPTIRYGIRCSLDIPEELDENIMVRELVPGALEGITGRVEM